MRFNLRICFKCICDKDDVNNLRAIEMYSKTDLLYEYSGKHEVILINGCILSECPYKLEHMVTGIEINDDAHVEWNSEELDHIYVDGEKIGL